MIYVSNILLYCCCVTLKFKWQCGGHSHPAMQHIVPHYILLLLLLFWLLRAKRKFLSHRWTLITMVDTQHFCLRWNNYQSSITSAFENLRDDEDFVDVTLACDGKSLKAHRVVLSACSPYFRELLKVSLSIFFSLRVHPF